MKVTQLCSSRSGKPVPNQFSIHHTSIIYFQSYSSMIGYYNSKTGKLYLDPMYYKFSVTTSKYLHIWLRDVLLLDSTLAIENALFKDLNNGN